MKLISQALFSLISLSFFSAPILTFADNTQSNTPANKPVAITPEQNILNINLKANPSTGYSWYLDKFNAQFFKFNTYQFTPGKIQMPGAPGQASFSFDINPAFHAAPYLTSIKFTYMRPWDMSTAMHQTLWVLSIPGMPAQVTAAPPTPTPVNTQTTSSDSEDKTPDVRTPDVSTPDVSNSNASSTNTTWLSIPSGA